MSGGAVIQGARVLVCGGRDYVDQDVVNEVLDGIHERTSIGVVIHGGASGADTCARRWADAKQIAHWAFPAQWSKHGRAAGPIRNQMMLEESRPNLVVAFPGGRGTADMSRRATEAGVQLLVVKVSE